MDAKGEVSCVRVGLNGDGVVGLARVTGVCVRISLRVGHSHEKICIIAVACTIYSPMNNTC